MAHNGLGHASEPGPAGDMERAGEARRPVRGRPRDPGVDVAIRPATVDLLAEARYPRLTMDQGAARARVSKDSLDRRSPHKAALGAHALQHRARPAPPAP